MRLLYFNWVDYLNSEKRGGGVTVYQKNLINSLANNTDIDIYFLASGTEYSLSHSGPHVRERDTYLGSRRFELYNSEVPAPGHLSFHNANSVHAQATTDAFDQFIAEHGPFDAIHFNNLEGLPAEVLALKQKYPETKIVFSMHNYYPLCPQVNLWYREQKNCTDYNGGKNCSTCLEYEPNPVGEKKARLLSNALNKVGIKNSSKLHWLFFMLIRSLYGFFRRDLYGFFRRDLYGFFKRALHGLFKQPSSKKADIELEKLIPLNSSLQKYHQNRRQEFIHYINSYCDTVLAVSERVQEVAIKFGIDPSIIRTSYIGSKVAESYASPNLDLLSKGLAEKKTITLGYLGYMRRDKGFYFLMDALEEVPERLAAKLNLIIAAQMHDHLVWKRLTAIADRFNSVEYSNGYTHSMLDNIYGKLDLALVPVLWEDNLPQVAIESACHHTAVLTSNLGGAKEIGGNNPLFIFEAGDTDSFIEKLKAFSDQPLLLLDYWKTSMAPVTMKQHIADLLDAYTQKNISAGKGNSEGEVPHAMANAG